VGHFSTVPVDDALNRRFHESGVKVDDVVLAWSGAYPAFGGYTNWGLFFTRPRLLVLVGSEISIWSTYTGPSPIRPILTVPAQSVRLDRRQARGYDRWIVGDRRLWVRVHDRGSVLGWTDA
jgi:hypothetical protein